MLHWLKKHWWRLLISIVLVGMAGFIAWGVIIPPPMAEALADMQTSPQVSVSTDPWLIFQPIDDTPDTGLILYPGGRVNPRAYAPAAKAISNQGYLVVIVPMPLNLAVFGSERAAKVIQAYPEVQDWVIGGHSLGGSMAALFAYKHPAQIQGLVLWASYPASSNSLANSDILVTSIFATQDGLATKDKIDASRALLPADTTWVQIDGGNHAQFGWYGTQSGDLVATIGRQEQQAQVVKATLDLLEVVSEIP